MPMYKYKCENCGETKYLLRSIKDRDNEVICDKCHHKMVRDFNNTNPDIKFAAAGFYTTRGADPILDPEK